MIDRTDGGVSTPTVSARRRSGRTRLRGVLLVGLAALAVVSISACEILNEFIPSPIDITVRNLCSGPNFTVSVYINHVYRGNVTYEQTYGGITPGRVWLRAIGTGSGGANIQADYYLYADSIWTLCPSGGGGGTLSVGPDTED